ncbi:MAG: hypothetical protein ICV66_01540 [Chitinophagaceae bacterium]|nr:hypothetical protein [Chitinophagaceae bacterium]
MKILMTLVCLSFILTSKAASAIGPAAVQRNEYLKNLKPVTIKNIQQAIRRKLTIKEKIALLIFKNKIKYADNSKSGKTALVFGIIGAALFFLGLFIPYVLLGSIAAAIVAVVIGSGAKRRNKDDRKAHAAVLLGWITLGLTALIFLAAIIVFATGGFYF